MEKRQDALKRNAAAALAIVWMACFPAPAATEDPPPAAGSISMELAAIYEADQKDRTFETSPTTEQWREISARDAARLARVKEIVSEGLLTEADDWYHAAMVLQHGSGEENILMAHVLATVAGFKGHAKGPWLAAASLDRYLHRTERGQIFGTQKLLVDGEWTQEPYDRGLHQAIRAEYGLKPAK